MKDQHTYDPEDIESLLLHKEFHELYPEEKDFVLRHIDTEAEYIEMRNTLLAIRQSSVVQSPPPNRVKEKAMNAFRDEYAKKPRFSLNGWLLGLFSFEGYWYRHPALQLGMVLILVVSGIVFFPASESPARMAENVNLKMDSLRSVQESKKEKIEVEEQPENDTNTAFQESTRLAEESEKTLEETPVSAALADVVFDEERKEEDLVVQQPDEVATEESKPVADLSARTNENMATSNDVIAIDMSDFEEDVATEGNATFQSSYELSEVHSTPITTNFATESISSKELSGVEITPYFSDEEKALPALTPMLDANQNRRLMKVLYSTY